MTTEAYVSN